MPNEDIGVNLFLQILHYISYISLGKVVFEGLQNMLNTILLRTLDLWFTEYVHIFFNVLLDKSIV